MHERLKCSKNCQFKGKGQIRPCSGEVYENNIVCMDNIKRDPALIQFGEIIPYAGMDDLMNHEVEVLKSVLDKEGRSKNILVATISGGAVTILS